jgi:hypothetical protein
MLEDFIKAYDIDQDAVVRIRHRLFVVGRFNQRRKGDPYPEVFLFTNRPTGVLSDEYRRNFDDVKDLRYESFVECLKPALAEKIEYQGDNPDTAIPKVLQKVPRGGEKDVPGGIDYDEGAAVVDVFNYLFQRGILSTFQGAMSDERPALPDGLDKVGGKHAGRGIFWLIRQNLHVFATFQPQTHEIVNAVSSLFDACSTEQGMPSYAEGGALPGGFPERLIDFVYAEDSRLPFTAEGKGIDFSVGRWGVLRDKNKLKMFENVVTAFRDALLGSKNQQFGTLPFKGQTLNYQAQASVPANLAKQFKGAREAYNGLRQVLRSKALISMVLDWVLTAYYDLNEVKALGPDAKPAEKDEAVARAILEKWKENGVAKPVPRPSLAERDRFSEELTANFERLLLALVADPATKAAKLAELPAEIRSLADQIQDKHPERVRALAGIMAPDTDADYRRAFIEASKVILLDILCPELYQQPILSEDMVRRLFKQETMSTYLTAVFLATDSKDAVRLIGEKNLEFFQSKIVSQKITESAKIQEHLLDEFIELISSPEIQRRLTDGLRVLREAQTILENAPPGGAAGSISAVRPDPLLKKNVTLERTELKLEDVNASIRAIVQKTVDSKAASSAAKGAGAGGVGATASGGAATGEAPRSGPARATAESSVGASAASNEQGFLGQSDIERDVAGKVAGVITGFFEKRKTHAIEKGDVAELVDQATTELLHDDGFMGRVRKDVRAYEQALFLIYQRYLDNPDKTNFRNRVERLTLINAMLLFRKELGLGTVSSNLYHLLIDLIQHLDPENPDPAKFIKKESLTRYFDNVKLEQDGVMNLRKTLEAQAYENLRETVDFISELWGIKYLIDRVKDDPDAEVVLLNATADEFLYWLNVDNLTDVDKGKGRLRCDFLLKGGNRSDSRIPPGLVYLTDAAFGKVGVDPKSGFLTKLKTTKLRSGSLSMLLPPLCISTRTLQGDDVWKTEGASWARAASGVRAPVVVVGPSAFLNSPEDHFRTYLPAGYLFAAHFLSHPTQTIIIRNVNAECEGRFRVIGAGGAFIHESFVKVNWPRGAGDKYCFAADYYLYMILTILAAAKFGGKQFKDEQAADYYANFHCPKTARENWESSVAINNALIGDNALNFSMSPPIASGVPLRSVDVDEAGISASRTPVHVNDIEWFNLARRWAGLP